MPLPLAHVVQRRHTSDSKRVRSMRVPRSPLHSRFDSPGVCPISLFDRLPVELQIEIFTLSLAPLPHIDKNEAPLLLCGVSQAWRALVLSVPKLWSSFEVEVSESAPQYNTYIERMMDLWLARSKTYPLTVSIVHWRINPGRMPDDCSTRLLALLIPESHRWRSLQLIIPTANMIPLPSHFPLLQSLALQPKGLWKSVPSVNISTANIPWSQLSELDLQLEPNNLPSLGDTLSILSQTSRLRVCKIGVDCTLDRDMAFDNLLLPVLEELHLILQGGNAFPFPPDGPAVSLTEFLDHISMPTLRTLDITWLVQQPPLWPNRHLFISFLRRISSTLKTLTLSYPPVSEIELVDILKIFLKLTHLHLRFSLDHNHDPVSDDLLSLLTLRNPSGSHPLLPSLVSLDFQCSGMNFSTSALLALVQSRVKKDAGSRSGFGHFGLVSMKPTLQEFEKQVPLMILDELDISVSTVSLR